MLLHLCDISEHHWRVPEDKRPPSTEQRLADALNQIALFRAVPSLRCVGESVRAAMPACLPACLSRVSFACDVPISSLIAKCANACVQS